MHSVIGVEPGWFRDGTEVRLVSDWVELGWDYGGTRVILYSNVSLMCNACPSEQHGFAIPYSDGQYY